MTRLSTSLLVIAAVTLQLCAGSSCSRKGTGEVAKLTESIHGLYLGEAKDEVVKRARGVATITMAPKPPLGYRGELYNLSAPLEPFPGIDHIRLAFFGNQLWEIIVYFNDTSEYHLLWLKTKLEGQYGTQATAPDGTTETTFKTYRLPGPGMSITLRRITKKETTELYVQYIHNGLHEKLMEKERAR